MKVIRRHLAIALICFLASGGLHDVTSTETTIVTTPAATTQDATTTPGVTTTPAATTQDVTATPGVMTTPAATTQDVTTTPGVTTTPAATTQDATTTPGVTTTPAATTQDVTTTPGVRTTPAATTQDVTTTPGVTTTPAATTQDIKTTPEVTTPAATTQDATTTPGVTTTPAATTQDIKTTPEVTTPAATTQDMTTTPGITATPILTTTPGEEDILVVMKASFESISRSLTELLNFVDSVSEPEDNTDEGNDDDDKEDDQERRKSLQTLTKVTNDGSDICSSDEKGDEALCTRLADALDDVEEVSEEIKERDTATRDQLNKLTKAQADLSLVVGDIKKDSDFVRSSIDRENLKKRVDDVESSVNEAKSEVDRRIDDQSGGDDQTLAIVLGVIGGILGVALIAFGVVYILKQKKNKKQKKVPEELGTVEGQDNEGFEDTSK